MQERKIDDNLLLEMLREGKTQREIARTMKVSEPAVCKRVKRLLPPPPSLEVLTAKERRFAIERAGGRTATQAALKAYECSSLQSAKAIGSQLMGKLDVQTAIGDLMEMKGIGRNFRVDKLGEHMRHPDPVISLKALDMGFKLSGDEEEAKRQSPAKGSYTEINLDIFRVK
jgi:hypothetical protein